MGTLVVDNIKTSKLFPPQRAQARYQEMGKYKEYVGGKFTQLYSIADEDRNFTIQKNMFKFVRDFWEVSVALDKPVINSNDDRTQELVETLYDSLADSLRVIAGDMVTYGSGLLVNNLPGQVQVVPPQYYFPVRDAGNLTTTNNDVDIIAYPYISGDDSASDRLRKYIYQDDMMQVLTYKLSGITLDSVLGSYKAPAGSPILVSVDNEYFGTSFMRDIQDYVAQIHRRESIIDEALDKQASPHLLVPRNALEKDDSGRYVVSLDGMVITYPEETTTNLQPKYLEWNARFDAQEIAIKNAMNNIYRLTHIAPVLFDDEVKTGSVTSGAALRRLAVPTVSMINQIRNKLNVAIRQAIVDQGRVFYNRNIDEDDISITWSEPLSTGIIDSVESVIRAVETGLLDANIVKQQLSDITQRLAEETGETTNATSQD